MNLQNSASLTLNASLLCPETNSHQVDRLFADSSENVKLVFTKSGSEVSICEIQNVKPQISFESKGISREINISSCVDVLKNARYGEINFYLVEGNVSKEYKRFRYNDEPTIYNPSEPHFDIIFTDIDDTARSSRCDELGDPVLVQLDTANPLKIALTSAENGVMFDLLGRRNRNEKVKTAWFASSATENYFLTLPKDGEIGGIDEMFGDNTLGPDNSYSKQGFSALSKHDENQDSLIDSSDGVFSKLRLWKDENLDGVAQSTELHTLAEKQVKIIDLRFDDQFRETDRFGNKVKFKSIIVMEDNRYGLAYDLWLTFVRP